MSMRSKTHREAHAGSALRGTRQQALWLATLGFFGGFAGVAVFGPLVPKFATLLGLGPFAAGVLAAMPSLTGSVLRIPFGAAVDRVGGRRPFLVLLGITIAGMTGLIVLLATSYPHHMAGTYPLLLLLGALIGCGIATFSVGIAQVSYWFPRNRQGSALGIYGGLGNTSSGLSTLLLPVAVGGMGIAASYSIWLGILFAITLVYAIVIRDAPVFQLRRRGGAVDPGRIGSLGGGETVPSGSAAGALRRAAREPVTWLFVYFYFLSFGGFLAFTSWLPTYWHHMYGDALSTAGLLTAVFSLLSAVIRTPAGVLSDRISIRYALAGNFLLMLAGTLGLSFSDSFPVSFTAAMAIATGMGLQNAIVFKLLPRYLPDVVGGASGWVGGLGAFGGFALPPLFGAVTGMLGGAAAYALGFLPFAGLILLALPLVSVLGRLSRGQLVPA